MGLSVGSISSTYGMNYIQPMNYSVDNESEVSDEFVQRGVQGLVPNVQPVGYPNAQAISSVADDEDNPLEMAVNTVRKSQEAGKMYNEVAARFQGMTVGYDSSLSGVGYGIAGSTLDLFA